MSAFPWFRMYCDFLEDPKMIALAFEDQRHFIGILALKSSGILDQNCDEKMMNRIVAQKLWISYDAILDVKGRLVSAGLIYDDWNPVAWDKRQCGSDRDTSAAERQKRYRERRNALRNGEARNDVTRVDKSRQEESRQEEKNKNHSAARFDFLQALLDALVPENEARDYLATRKAKKCVQTETAFRLLKGEADRAGMALLDVVRLCIKRGWGGFDAAWVGDSSFRGGKAANGARFDLDHCDEKDYGTGGRI